MDQRAKDRPAVLLDRPIHRACLVPGCPCGSTPVSRSTTTGAALVRPTGPNEADRVDITWRCIGLPDA